MKVEGFDKSYQVKDYTMKRAGGEIAMRWKYARGTHFFVLLYDSRRDVDLGEIVREMEEEGLDDQAVLRKNGHHIYTTRDEKGKVFLFREREFVNNGQCCSIPGGEVRRSVPYGVSVFIGEYDRAEGVMHLYEAGDREANTQFIPVKLEVQIRYKQKLFAKEKLCILHVPGLPEYTDGALQYHVDGVRTNFPLPAGCLGRDLFLTIPKDASVAVRVADPYKKYYRV